MSLRLQIVIPEARVFDGEAEWVELPTLEGQIGVYPGHVRLIAGLGVGEIRAYTKDGVASFVIAGGHVKIEPFLISVLAMFSSSEDEKVEIEEACKRAKSAMELTENQPKQIDADLVRLRMELARWKKGMKLRPGEP
jgi:F-type H+-transporting ATPase subunit epsilon